MSDDLTISNLQSVNRTQADQILALTRERDAARALVDQLNAKLDVQNLARCSKCGTTVPTDEGLRARLAAMSDFEAVANVAKVTYEIVGKERDAARAQCAAWKADYEKADAACAVMRSALEWLKIRVYTPPGGDRAEGSRRVDEALASEGGLALIEQLHRYEQALLRIVDGGEVRASAANVSIASVALRLHG